MNRTRGAGVLMAAGGLALLMAACGGGSPSSSSPAHAAASSTSASGVAYSACMRSAGVPSFPDPTSDEPVLKADPQQLGVSTAQYERARQACQPLVPDTGSTQYEQQETQCTASGTCSPAVVQKWMTDLRTLAGCLRSHGVPNWPDPVTTSQGIPHFPYERDRIDRHSAPILAEVKTCTRLTGFHGLPLP